MIVYISNFPNSTKQLLQLINNFSKVAMYKINSNKWILAQNFVVPKTQFTDHMKLKKKKDQSADNLDFLRRGNKIPMGRDREEMCGAKTEGKTI